MKRPILFLLGALVCLFAAAQISSSGDGGSLETRQKASSSTSTTHRSPLLLPTVTYWIEFDAQTLEINSSTECDGETFIYNSVGVIIDYEPSVNAIFDISSYPSGSYFIVVSSSVWVAEGLISI